MRIAALLLLLFPSQQVNASELRFEGAGSSQAVPLQQLKRKLKAGKMSVQDPVYKKQKTYEGFWLQDLLKLSGLAEQGGDEIVFQCADGYAPSIPFSKLSQAKGLLAYREVGAPGGWSRFRHGKSMITPAPFYLVWDNPDPHAFPWPYQVVGIEVVRFKEKYGSLFPEGEAADSPVTRGFQVFRNDCLRCHSLNLQGGAIGPELNIPRNITEYRDEATLREFIRNAESFRARSKMPPFKGLKDEELDAILAYLRWMKDHKKAP